MDNYRSQGRNAQAMALKDAANFYEGKLRTYPNMSRYSHYMAAISAAQGDDDKADAYYRQTIVCAPNDITARSDFAIHLANEDRRQEAIKELKKATLIVENNSLLQKNLGAMLARTGDTRGAMKHATQARFLAPHDAQNHRNLARLYSSMGDTYTALQHNMTSIELEDHRLVKPNTSAYRAAAVQIIARSGTRESALALMSAARAIENKHIELPTSERTYEIIHKIKQRQAHQLEQAEREKHAAEERRRAAEQEWQKVVTRSSNW